MPKPTRKHEPPGVNRALERIWYQSVRPPWLLRSLSRLYARIADRRAARHKAAAVRLPVPVVVVGNVAVGGTGKTPCVLWVVRLLQERGHRPGILSRGYRGRGPFPCVVTAATTARTCGDEPLLLARRSGVPVVCAPDRIAAGRTLLAAFPDVDVLVCDDGLQHYALARDLEFCVVDGVRGFGNGWRLPAGPLREMPERAARCALQLVNGGAAAGGGSGAVRFDLELGMAQRVGGPQQRPLAEFAAGPVYAVAGIGRPERFFAALRAAGLAPVTRAFADHHAYRAQDFAFAGGAPVLMTEKDAVKCEALGVAALWSVPATVRATVSDAARVTQCLARVFDSAPAASHPSTQASP
ncbi:MAG: tetraacyldisaccharide 4'-kinase [Nevskiaceae bacterium]|nr:MAG: tetraacyldisaccharide 4'-kinase [Nevskiaceae bacterium]TBR73319.1 MAG: tetraacyldisaccharide 4'-kinase [Nevskiaceae bacterium]